MITSSNSSLSPPISTSRTPDNASISNLSLCAIFNKVRSGTGPEKTTVSTGNKDTLTSVTRGSSLPGGSSAFARSTFSRTSNSALSASKPASNSKVTEPKPCAAVERISFSPSILLSSFSSGRTNSRSASCGAMPS